MSANTRGLLRDSKLAAFATKPDMAEVRAYNGEGMQEVLLQRDPHSRHVAGQLLQGCDVVGFSQRPRRLPEVLCPAVMQLIEHLVPDRVGNSTTTESSQLMAVLGGEVGSAGEGEGLRYAGGAADDHGAQG